MTYDCACRTSIRCFARTASSGDICGATCARFTRGATLRTEPWRDGLLKLGLPVHLVNHLVTMADLHRAGRYDRMSDDVLTLTGQGPPSVQEVVRKNTAIFTAPPKEAI
jgi:hypothetical protein